MNKIYYIIIRGPLGIGKTTIAKKLAKILKADYISIDKILKNMNLDELDQKQGCVPLNNFLKVDEKIIPTIKESLEKGKKVIIECCFYHKENIEHLIHNLNFKNYVITLKAPVEVCLERDRKREKCLGEKAAIEVHKLVSRFDHGIIINTENKTEDQVVKEIMEKLK
ncbi:MAG: AAA family ATPase [Candidatus Pacearchaeota archaeon]|nr:AAA family ATPase [Candidatus Pacearchaeota archaeon]